MKSYHTETETIRTQIPRTPFQEHSAPLYLTSSFVFEDAEDMRASFAEEKDRNIYSRYSNPNSDELIRKVCLMEGAEDGFAFASGMAAVFSTFAALLDSGVFDDRAIEKIAGANACRVFATRLPGGSAERAEKICAGLVPN